MVPVFIIIGIVGLLSALICIIIGFGLLLMALFNRIVK